MKFLRSVLAVISVSYVLFQPLYAEDIASLSPELLSRIEALSLKHNLITNRPKSCPLVSNNHADIWNKINALRELFQDCPNGESEKLKKIVSAGQDAQASLNQLNATTGTVSSETASTINMRGAQLTTALNGLNTLVETTQCKFKNGSLLSNSADLIQSISQMGLLVPSTPGIAVAGGGAAVSSLLRLLDAILSDRFDFSKVSDRHSFIKLNCSFYDLRKQIEKAGILTIPTPMYVESEKEAKDLLVIVKAYEKEIEEQLKNLLTEIEEKKKAVLESEKEQLYATLKTFNEAKALVSSDIQNETQKLRMITDLSIMNLKLRDAQSKYQKMNLSKVPVMDILFQNELTQFDSLGHMDIFVDLTRKPLAEFQKIYGGIKFHIERVQENLATYFTERSKRYENEVMRRGVTILALKKQLQNDFDSRKGKVAKAKEELSFILKKVEQILNSNDYTAYDQGNEHEVNILSYYDEIAQKVYGKWGEEFLDYITKTSYEHNKTFVNKFENFSEKHLKTIPTKESIDSLSQMDKVTFCQDSYPYRKMWNLSHGLVQQGYDFINTNKDLFQSDVSKIKLYYKKIQNHYRSSYFARQHLQGADIDLEIKEKYFKDKQLGNIMIEVEKSSKIAQKFQEYIDLYECDRVLSRE